LFDFRKTFAFLKFILKTNLALSPYLTDDPSSSAKRAVSPDPDPCRDACSQWANSSTDTPTNCETWKCDCASNLGSNSADSSGAKENWGRKDGEDGLHSVNIGEALRHENKARGQKVDAATPSQDAEQCDHHNGLVHLDAIN